VDLWAHVEAISHRDRSGKHLVSAFRFFTALHRDDPDLKSPSLLVLRGGHSDLSDLYRASATFMLAYKRLVEAYDVDGETDQSGMRFKHRTYSLLALLVRDAKAAILLARDGFGAFAIHPSFVKKVEAVRTWQPAATLVNLLGRFDSARWQAPSVTVYGHVANLTDLCAYSQAMFDDLVTYAARLGPTAPDGQRGLHTRDNLTTLQRLLPRLSELLEQRDLVSLQQRGFVALVEDDCRRLRTMYLGRQVVRGAFPIAKAITDVLFPDIARDAIQLAPYQVTFTNRFAERPLYCDYGPIRELSVRLRDGYLPADFGWPNIEPAVRQVKVSIEKRLEFRGEEIFRRHTPFVARGIDFYRKFRDEGFEDVGDFDVLAYWPDHNLLVAVECKYNQPAYTMKDGRRIREKIFGRKEEDKGQIGKMLRRSAFLNMHRPRMLELLGWPKPAIAPERYVELYVSRDIYYWMVHPPYPVPTHFVRISTLDSWLKTELFTVAGLC